jgi:lipoprotein-anchoring transpeptidase ErfK/SrfK
MNRLRRFPSAIVIAAVAFAISCASASAQNSSAYDDDLPASLQRQVVFYRTNEPPGTIIVDTVYRHLYLVQENSRAIRYGIGVGPEGFEWQGLLRVSRKMEWPDGAPDGSRSGGAGNPMGARALYLGVNPYRINGTNQPRTIGSALPTGCYLLTNGDVIDLYSRVAVGTKVVVRQKPSL